MAMKNLVLAMLLIPALAACKSAYMASDDASEAAVVQEVPVEDPDTNRVRENDRDNEQMQGGS